MKDLFFARNWKLETVFLAVAVFLFAALPAGATLVDMNDGTIYDTDTQLSWLKDANYAMTSGYKEDAFMSWDMAVAWIASLNAGNGFAGLTGWRLPNADLSCAGNSFAYNCTNSEMGHIYYTELGNKGYCDVLGSCPQTGWGLINTSPFTNFQVYVPYWSGTECAWDPSSVWQFVFYSGCQVFGSKGSAGHTWAVRPGARSVIDLPRTGQTTSYAAGDDGAIQAGVAWPNPRFTDNGDQMITDNLTGLMWTKDAGAPTIGACTGGAMNWQAALDYVACLNSSNYIGHNDWRLPNINELDSIAGAEQ